MAYRLQYVNGIAFPDAGGGYCVETDGTYIFVAGNAGRVYAYSWDGANYTLAGSITISAGNSIYALYFDGTYLHVGMHTDVANNLRAYTFDGANFTLAGQADRDRSIYGIWYDGSYLYTCEQDDRITAWNWNGSTYSEIDTYAIFNSVYQIVTDGSYIYWSNGNGNVYAATFDGVVIGNVHSAVLASNRAVCIHNGSIIFCAGFAIYAYSYDGATFTQIDSYNIGESACEIISDGTYVFVLGGNGLLMALTFNGTSFSAVSGVGLPGNVTLIGTKKMCILNNYIHSGHTTGLDLQATKMSLQANISATPTTGRAPLTVQFYGS